LTDVDAITLSLAGQAKTTIAPALAVTAIMLAILSNTLVKCGLVVVLGAPPLKRRIVLATLLILTGGGLSLWLG
jgi:uncharacterized membrane protein (DUF4010 family)